MCADLGLPQLSLIFHTTLPSGVGWGGWWVHTLQSKTENIQMPDKVVVEIAVTVNYNVPLVI